MSGLCTSHQLKTKTLEKMAKRLSREEKEHQLTVDLVNKMFEIAGHQVTYDDVKDRKDDWFNDWTMTMAQREEWMDWGKKLLMKKFYMYARRAENEMQWAGLQWGLKFKTQEDGKIL